MWSRGKCQNSLAAAPVSFGNRVAITQPGVQVQGYIQPGAAALVGPNGVNQAIHFAGIMISSATLYDGRASTKLNHLKGPHGSSLRWHGVL